MMERSNTCSQQFQVNDAINRETKQCGTLLHGDVKGENILFNANPYAQNKRKGKTAVRAGSNPTLQCALYDLQYVGLGIVTLDLVYFLGTSVDRSLLSPSFEKELLQVYHTALVHAISSHADGRQHTYDFDLFWKHWELAIVDWYRFMAGWGFWGNDAWVESRAREIVSGWQTQNCEEL